jgi:hypothetical protein
MENPNLRDYMTAFINWATNQIRKADPRLLLEVWIEYALAHKLDAAQKLPDELIGTFQQLIALTAWLRHGHSYSERVAAYINYWNYVKKDILNPPEPSPPPQPEQKPQDSGKEKQPDESPRSKQEEMEDSDDQKEDKPEKEEKNGEDSKESGKPETGKGGVDEKSPTEDEDTDLDEPQPLESPYDIVKDDTIDIDLSEAIEGALESETEDVTEQVKELLGDTDKRIYPIVRSREKLAPMVQPDSQLRRKLERIMTIKKHLQMRTMHGEQNGRLDRRHLARIATDQKIFQQKYKFPDGFPKCRILIDLSGSMNGREEKEVLQASGALQTLVGAEVWGYDASGGKISLVRLDDGKLIHGHRAGGGTPSGLAITGISVGMKKDGLIIHLTDGDHNVGDSPMVSYQTLKERGIGLINILWGGRIPPSYLSPLSSVAINGLGEFPDALYEILVEQVKLGKLGG